MSARSTHNHIYIRDIIKISLCQNPVRKRPNEEKEYPKKNEAKSQLHRVQT